MQEQWDHLVCSYLTSILSISHVINIKEDRNRGAEWKTANAWGFTHSMQCCTYTHDKLSLHRALMLERIKVQSCYWTTYCQVHGMNRKCLKGLTLEQIGRNSLEFANTTGKVWKEMRETALLASVSPIRFQIFLHC